MPIDREYVVDDMVLYAENTYSVYKHFQEYTLIKIIDLITKGQWGNKSKRDSILGEFANFVLSQYAQQIYAPAPRLSRSEKEELQQKLYKSFEEMIVDAI